DDVRGIRLFDDVGGLAEAGVDVAVLLDVAFALVADRVHDDGVEDLRRVGRDGGDRIALIHRLRVRLIFPDDCRADAGRGLRGGQVDGHDARVRKRRTDDLAVDHPGPVDV